MNENQSREVAPDLHGKITAKCNELLDGISPDKPEAAVHLSQAVLNLLYVRSVELVPPSN